MLRNIFLILLSLLLPYLSFSQQKDSVFICGMEDTQPEFPGGFMALNKYISTNIQYPDSAKDAGVQGWVVLNFTIKKDGSITDVKIQRDLGSGCGKEAKRAFLSMPKWKPGSTNGVPVDVYYTMPVKFKLEE